MPKDKSIRGLDEKLYQQAKVAALKEKMFLGEWLNRAIAAYLKGASRVNIIRDDSSASSVTTHR